MDNFLSMIDQAIKLELFRVATITFFTLILGDTIMNTISNLIELSIDSVIEVIGVEKLAATFGVLTLATALVWMSI